jgi:hypothetical protein
VLDQLTRQLRTDKAVDAERHSQPHLTFGRSYTVLEYQLCTPTFSMYMCIQQMEKLLLFESMLQP